MRISDWSSDVCSSDLLAAAAGAVPRRTAQEHPAGFGGAGADAGVHPGAGGDPAQPLRDFRRTVGRADPVHHAQHAAAVAGAADAVRSEEHTSELQSLMRISYAVFCLKKKINTYTVNPSPSIHATHLRSPQHSQDILCRHS